ncbi:hypothetical protein H0176_22400 [Methylorubrum populi]|uniref:hypothetical protein n=1 Tax=Methylorubrum rhodesianum TaxID=29427 RepID=UPI0019092CF1|nr:hypothetical protein [Methylorubrum rhodesianum]MBK3404211.1 hypothetical protein [Methylorubrum rhodesianum]MBY0143001.1 hypothetical protein [Methylorubrum populi]
MHSYVITYDLEDGDPSPYEPFIEEAEKQGLLYVWHGKSLLLRLPNTTLWGRFDRIEDARSAFDRAIKKASRRVDYVINVKKRSTVKVGDLSVKSDVRKAPAAKWTGDSKFETARLHQLRDPDFSY